MLIANKHLFEKKWMRETCLAKRDAHQSGPEGHLKAHWCVPFGRKKNNPGSTGPIKTMTLTMLMTWFWYGAFQARNQRACTGAALNGSPT